MVPVPGPTVNVGSVTAVKSVKESILVSTAPFGPQHCLLSAHGPQALHGANVRGVETMIRLSTSPVNNVNSVQFSRSVSVSRSLFPVPVTVVASPALVSLTSSRPQGLPAQTPLSSTCVVANTFQDLVPPSRVTPSDAHKLCELCFLPDQVKVDYVISGLTNGFRLDFDPSAVSLQSASHNMPTASFQPSVIDQYLRTEREKGRVAGPFLISPIPNLHVSRFGVILKKHQLFKDWHIPHHPDKVEGPSACLTVLGIELDSLALQGPLPRGKIERIVAFLAC